MALVAAASSAQAAAPAVGPATLADGERAFQKCYACHSLEGPDPRLQAVLPEEVDVIRQFWLSYSEDLRKLKRVTLAAEYLRACADLNRPLLMGESSQMHYLPPG